MHPLLIYSPHLINAPHSSDIHIALPLSPRNINMFESPEHTTTIVSIIVPVTIVSSHRHCVPRKQNGGFSPESIGLGFRRSGYKSQFCYRFPVGPWVSHQAFLCLGIGTYLLPQQKHGRMNSCLSIIHRPKVLWKCKALFLFTR